MYPTRFLLAAVAVGAAAVLASAPAQATPGDQPGVTKDTHDRVLSGPGSITIHKVDEHGDPLPSSQPASGAGKNSPYAFFLLTSANGTEVIAADQDRLIGKAPLNDSNKDLAAITVSDLPFGTYTVTEIYQPDGYALNDTRYTVTINPDHPAGAITVQDHPGADLPLGSSFDPGFDVHVTADTALADHVGQVITFTITATNTGNTVLNGLDAGFHRFGSANGVRDNPYHDLPGPTTASSGITDAFINSPAGCTPYRYLLPGQKVSCTVSYTVTATDLAWATNNEANAKWDKTCNIVFGDWFAVWDRYNSQYNFSTLAGDDVRDNPQTYRQRRRLIEEDYVTVPTSCLRAPTVAWRKVDAKDSHALSGAAFSVTDPTGARTSVADNGQSDADPRPGYFLLHGRMPAGEYTLRETKAPEGYQLENRTWTFTLDSTHAKVDLGAIVNEAKPGAVTPQPTQLTTPTKPATPTKPSGPKVDTGGNTLAQPGDTASSGLPLQASGGALLVLGLAALVRSRARVRVRSQV